jgi:hypothetical protein
VVIIQADDPVISPDMSRAIGTIHAQYSAIATISAATMSQCSRFGRRLRLGVHIHAARKFDQGLRYSS